MIFKPSIFICFFIVAFLFGSKQASSQDKNWTHFRGSNLNGMTADENIPLKWDDSVIKWKTEIHDRGYSSPVVYNNQIWVTTAKSDGKELYAVCVNYQTGKIIYDIKVFTPEEVEGKHSLNTYASPTPCIEKGFVYVHYGSMGTACINSANGSIVWERTDFKCKHVQGPASSPVIYKNLLILHYEGTDVRFIVALDKSNGKLIWRSDRPAEPYRPITEIGRKAYTTPIIINVKGRDMLISPGSAVCIAYDPNSGKGIWRVVDGAESTIAMPFTENGVVYWYAGYMVTSDNIKFTELVAVNPDGKGDITATNVIWKKWEELSRNQSLSPVIKDGLIYTVNTRNIMMCIDASTGEEIWSTHVRSNYDASPIYVNGNIWFFSVKGEVLVIKAGRKYEVVAQNQMDSGIWATPAILRNSVILRTQKYLYRIAQE
ncbi:MAG TPA: PQQ-binding-like beta-propeller repeat protein [Bacteroidales bacterium]|nr:PQQ-binding-like beta-propeller repeat protein [Bacteroidales bacterium]